MGKKRVPTVVDDGTVHLTLAFAAGETKRTIQGYAPFRPEASASGGTVGPVAYNRTTKRFQLPVTAALSGNVEVYIGKTVTPSPSAASKPAQPR
jgi:hypothetical protein